MNETYKIIRMFKDGSSQVTMAEGLTLEEAQEWCRDPETSSSTAQGAEARDFTARRGEWFDGYEEE